MMPALKQPDFWSRFSARHNAAEILTYFDNASYLKALVIGETIIDEYQHCEALGKSSKEPTLALRRLSVEKFAGGIVAVGNHLSNFCESVGLVSRLGEIDTQEAFITGKLSGNVKAYFTYQKNAPTIVKRRFIEATRFAKLLEIYEINTDLDPEDDEKLCDLLRLLLPGYDVVIVVDYGHGMLSPEAVKTICGTARFLAVNTQSNAENHGYHTISRYSRADLVCLTEKEIRLETRDRRGGLREQMMEVSSRLEGARVAVTLGKDGCSCYGKGEGFSEVPAFTTKVVDRIGSGDAFLSLAALCAAQQAPLDVVGFAGNAAGSHAVQTVGHRQSAERGLIDRSILELLNGGEPAPSVDVSRMSGAMAQPQPARALLQEN